MGACFSGANRFPDIEGLGFSRRQTARLNRVFRRVDTSKDDQIGLHELLMFIDEENNCFMHRVFSLFDVDKSGSICFMEFACCCLAYCALTKETLSMFSFNLYDGDLSGVLDRSEVKTMLTEIYSGSVRKVGENPQAKRIYQLLCTGQREGTCNLARFQEFLRKHPSLLFPAFTLQRRLQKLVLGRRFWKQKTKQLKRERELMKKKELIMGKRAYQKKAAEQLVPEQLVHTMKLVANLEHARWKAQQADEEGLHGVWERGRLGKKPSRLVDLDDTMAVFTEDPTALNNTMVIFGEDWEDHTVVWKQAAGYSSMTVLDDGRVGIFYERNNHTMTVFEAQSVSWATFAA
jgi:Ca2+-binding EF-hand superfamily protein